LKLKVAARINQSERTYHSILVCRHMSCGNFSVNLRPHFRHIASRLAAKWAVGSARTEMARFRKHGQNGK